MFQSNMSHILLLLSLEMWSPPTWGKGKKKKKIWRNIYFAHSLKEEMISTCYYDRVTSKYESQNISTYIYTQNFTEKLASILKGWSSLNNNKKMKRFSTSYTGFSSLWSWRSRKDFNIYLGGLGDLYWGKWGGGQRQGGIIQLVFFTRTVFFVCFYGRMSLVGCCDFYIKNDSHPSNSILCKASYIFYNNFFCKMKLYNTWPHARTRTRWRHGVY